MKTSLVVLLGSIAVNGALLTALFLQPTLAPEFARPAFSFGQPATVAHAESGLPGRVSRSASTPRPETLWSQLATEDLPTLIARLRAAGFPPAVVRSIVDAELQRRFAPRVQELSASFAEVPYWKPDAGVESTMQRYERMNQVSRERVRMLRDLLGEDAYAFYGSASSSQQRQYGNLSPTKIDLVRRITEDYAEMTAEIRASMQGISLPEDKEKFALLERSRREDLAAILTPEELADYELRTSPITLRLRTPLAIMRASEAEFRAIYAANQTHNPPATPTTGMSLIASEMMAERRQAAERVNEQVKAALGPDRFAEYQRAMDNDYQQLYRVGMSAGLPVDTLNRAHDLRDPAGEASMAIAEDRSMDATQKLAAMRTLAQETRTKLLSTLGPTVGPRYVENLRWLTQLEHGTAFRIDANGMMTGRRVSLPTPAR